jgi:AcrR family transcriptional regulator
MHFLAITMGICCNEKMKTEEKIITGFLRLLETQPVQAITIKMLCHETKISRVTFYAYFSNIQSIYSYLVFDRYLKNKLDPYTNIKDGLVAATSFITKHKVLFVRLLKSPQRKEFFDFIKYQGMKHHMRWLDKFDQEQIMTLEEKKLMSKFYSIGYTELLFHWIDHNFKPGKKEFSRTTYLFLKGYIELALHNFKFYHVLKKLPNRQDIYKNFKDLDENKPE